MVLSVMASQRTVQIDSMGWAGLERALNVQSQPLSSRSSFAASCVALAVNNLSGLQCPHLQSGLRPALSAPQGGAGRCGRRGGEDGRAEEGSRVSATHFKSL